MGGKPCTTERGLAKSGRLTFGLVGRRWCFVEVGDASLERVLRKVDLRLGGEGNVSGEMGRGGSLILE